LLEGLGNSKKPRSLLIAPFTRVESGSDIKRIFAALIGFWSGLTNVPLKEVCATLIALTAHSSEKIMFLIFIGVVNRRINIIRYMIISYRLIENFVTKFSKRHIVLRFKCSWPTRLCVSLAWVGVAYLLQKWCKRVQTIFCKDMFFILNPQ